ncbi:hypothetical protein Pan153_00800 [Gimesia panareensis]|uniref:Uncharacterized protein n=1 Tax=Gimesia panareensis TaxID=2527978 RepID=A0A518FGJ9_9PLAN|nr:hypothetical protein [Gimesia panareensis]QDV15466.1 hypothetical protein Pan153_00800 [Gimesia panareensis]
MSDQPENTIKTPAKVLASLRPGYLTVYFGYGQGLADGGIPHEVPIDDIPFDLRLPNSEFTLILDCNGQILGVERYLSD